MGVWLAVTQGRFATLSFSFPSLSAAGLFMATGAIIMVVGFLGCLGAATEHRCLLLTVRSDRGRGGALHPILVAHEVDVFPFAITYLRGFQLGLLELYI